MKYELAEPSLLPHQIALVRKSLLQLQPIGGERGVRLRTSRPIRSRGGVNLLTSPIRALHQLILSLTPLFCWSYKSSLRRYLSSLTPQKLINQRNVYQLIPSSKLMLVLWRKNATICAHAQLSNHPSANPSIHHPFIHSSITPPSAHPMFSNSGQ